MCQFMSLKNNKASQVNGLLNQHFGKSLILQIVQQVESGLCRKQACTTFEMHLAPFPRAPFYLNQTPVFLNVFTLYNPNNSICWLCLFNVTRNDCKMSDIFVSPQSAEIETRLVLKKTAEAHWFLAELKGIAASILIKVYLLIRSLYRKQEKVMPLKISSPHLMICINRVIKQKFLFHQQPNTIVENPCQYCI